MELMRQAAIIQHVISLPVPMEPVTTRVRSVIRKLIAEIPLMKLIALGYACTMNLSVAMEIVFLAPMSVTMTMTAKITVMNTIATMIPVVATSSLAPVACVLARPGFVMEMMTA